MRLDCSAADLTPSSRTVVKNESVESLILLHERLRLYSENPEAILHQEEPEVGNASNNAQLIEGSDAKVAKEGASGVDTFDDELGRASTGYSSSSDESCPASPASKAITLAQLSTGYQFDHCLYFYWESWCYCWGTCADAPYESRICRVYTGADGSPILEAFDIISTATSGPFSMWGGLYFFHPDHQERRIYQRVGVGANLLIPTYSEYQDLVAHLQLATVNATDNTGLFVQPNEHLNLGGVALPNNMPQQFVGMPAESSQAPPPGNFNTHTQEAPIANAGNSPFEISTGNGAKCIALLDRDRVTIEAIEGFVDEHLSHNRRHQRIMCHICPSPKCNEPRTDNRPYALKEHLKSHFFKVQCMWCFQAYSNKANLIKNHSSCRAKPIGASLDMDRYKYVPRNRM